MGQEEIKHVVYITISCLALAFLLSLVSYFLGVRSDLAVIENERYGTEQALSAYYDYNKYQDVILYGEDVLGIICEFADSEIVVYVDKLTDDAGVEHEFFVNRVAYLDSPESYTVRALDYGSASNGLTGGIKRNVTYYGYLVFGDYTLEGMRRAKFSNKESPTAYGSVSGIVIRKVGEGRHNNAPSTAACGCEGNATLYGPCTAPTIYANVNAIQAGA